MLKTPENPIPAPTLAALAAFIEAMKHGDVSTMGAKRLGVQNVRQAVVILKYFGYPIIRTPRYEAIGERRQVVQYYSMDARHV